jgi:hypothetical protein
VKEVFADSFYFFAILNSSDPGYPDAIGYSEERNDRLVTTAWVLTEVADGLVPANSKLSRSARCNCAARGNRRGRPSDGILE